MDKVIEFFTYLLTNHGIWALLGFLLLICALLFLVIAVLFARSSLSKAIDCKLAEKIELDKQTHKMGNEMRKQFSTDVKELLQDLAKNTKSDRALVFEYSNGSSNLVGLPFLFATAASEVTTPGTSLVSDQYQRLNLSILAGFLTTLEKDGFVFIDDLEKEKDIYPVIYNMMKPNNVHSALFYAIRGIGEVVGFLVISTTENRKLDKKCAMNEIAKVAQLVSSMWNFEEVKELINKHNKKKWWQW